MLPKGTQNSYAKYKFELLLDQCISNSSIKLQTKAEKYQFEQKFGNSGKVHSNINSIGNKIKIYFKRVKLVSCLKCKIPLDLTTTPRE